MCVPDPAGFLVTRFPLRGLEVADKSAIAFQTSSGMKCQLLLFLAQEVKYGGYVGKDHICILKKKLTGLEPPEEE
jgi:hypothetical protein